jgi:uncharacterized protein YecT (DUF1311 family)
MIENIIYGIGGWIGGIATTFLLRWVRQDHITEEINRKKSALDLMEKMRALNVGMPEINAVLASFGEPLDKAEGQQNELDEIDRLEHTEINEAQSQHEMNQAALRRAERLDDKLADTVDRLKQVMPDLADRIDQAQKAWEAYRDVEVEIAGAPWEEGSMQPFIMSGMRSRLTQARIKGLEIDVANFTAG